jgi:hypothetical protein
LQFLQGRTALSADAPCIGTSEVSCLTICY